MLWWLEGSLTRHAKPAELKQVVEVKRQRRAPPVLSRPPGRRARAERRVEDFDAEGVVAAVSRLAIAVWPTPGSPDKRTGT